MNTVTGPLPAGTRRWSRPGSRWAGVRLPRTVAEYDAVTTPEAEEMMRAIIAECGIIGPTTERASARGAETPSGALGSPSDHSGGEP